MTYIDRWNVKIEIYDEKLDVGTPKIEETIMYLYLGLGLDARVVYYFNHYRKKYPGFFKSRIGNKFVYTGIGSKGLISFSDAANFKNRLKMFYNGNSTKLPLPDPEAILFQNTCYWGGGIYDCWNSENASEIQVTDTDALESKTDFLSNDPNLSPETNLKRRQNPTLTESSRGRPRSESVNIDEKEFSDEFLKQNMSDKKLECWSFRTMFHMGQTQIG